MNIKSLLEESMFRKTSVALAALLVASSAVIAPAADAATKISNGVTCAKKGATTKVGTDRYNCTTNPISTGAAAKKLVWVWSGCLDSNKAYLTSKTQYDAIMKQIAGQSTTIASTIQTSINNMILWKATKNYVKDDVVYETGKTYYIALAPSSNKTPSANLGTLWAVYMPTAADANVGTSPDVNKVLAMKEKDVVDWTESVTTMNTYIKSLEGLTNATAAQKTKLASYKTTVATINIGIKNANTNIKNLKANVILLTSQQANKATVESLKADVDQAKMIRAQSCARGI
jgi:hypothetical protein